LRTQVRKKKDSSIARGYKKKWKKQRGFQPAQVPTGQLPRVDRIKKSPRAPDSSPKDEGGDFSTEALTKWFGIWKKKNKKRGN